jgi:hypothetical protein
MHVKRRPRSCATVTPGCRAVSAGSLLAGSGVITPMSVATAVWRIEAGGSF